MSIGYDLRDLANSAAKKFDHAEVKKIHLLFALKRRFLRELENMDLGLLEEELAKIPRSSTNTLSIDSDVEALISEITSDERALEVAIRLSQEVLGQDIGLAIQSTEQQSGTANPLEASSTPDLESTMQGMNKLIGLDEVKTQVLKLINVHQANQVRSAQGLKKVPVGLHCVFTGSPGTGKTTVARYVAQMYHAIGLLPTAKLIEVDRSSLVAGYVGQTALKVQDAVQSALGGVLFIDEAYALTSDTGAGFGDEAVATLVKAMEDHRDSLAVIVAGYKEPMQQFVDSNQGLKSRFQTFIDFPDYTADELLEIFQYLCHSHEMKISQQAQGKLLSYLTLTNPKGDQGNARFVRNLFEKMYLSLSHRAASDGQIDLHEVTEFTELDIPEVEVRKSRIGFTPH